MEQQYKYPYFNPRFSRPIIMNNPMNNPMNPMYGPMNPMYGSMPMNNMYGSMPMNPKIISEETLSDYSMASKIINDRNNYINEKFKKRSMIPNRLSKKKESYSDRLAGYLRRRLSF